MKPVWIPLLSVCLLFSASPSLAQAPARQAVDVELCLAVDGSGPIEDDEFAFQRQAYAQALTDAKVVDIVTSGFNGGIAVALAIIRLLPVELLVSSGVGVPTGALILGQA